ncbi:hypothetical protein C8R44DRAFT_982192 [Mycena epipterygia]|nr:hypothetical protein C8R44DRAFT_982192 [Mycena epipterygia]
MSTTTPASAVAASSSTLPPFSSLSAMFTVRAAVQGGSLSSDGSIQIFHPGYTQLCLVRFRVYPIEGHTVPGQLLKLILDGPDHIQQHVGDVIIPVGNYEYHIQSATSTPYAICTKFRSWTPPVDVPDNWRYQNWAGTDAGQQAFELAEFEKYVGKGSATICSTLKEKDGRCAVTGDTSRLDASYLIPRSETDWFIHRRPGVMFLEGGTANIDHVRNIITLRADVNGRAFDKAHFVLYPFDGQILSIFVHPESNDMAVNHHFTAVSIPHRILSQYLYGRFAWSIFELAKSSLGMADLVIGLSKIVVPKELRKISKPKTNDNAKGGRQSTLGSGPGVQGGFRATAPGGDINMDDVDTIYHDSDSHSCTAVDDMPLLDI